MLGLGAGFLFSLALGAAEKFCVINCDSCKSGTVVKAENKQK